MYPIGLNNTIIQRKKGTKMAAAMYPAVLQKNVMPPMHNDGLALIQKQHRSVHLDPIDPIVVHYY